MSDQCPNCGGTMTAERDAALAEVKRRDEILEIAKDALRMIERWDDNGPYDDPGYCATDALRKMDFVELSKKEGR